LANDNQSTVKIGGVKIAISGNNAPASGRSRGDAAAGLKEDPACGLEDAGREGAVAVRPKILKHFRFQPGDLTHRLRDPGERFQRQMPAA
jgi:hypothetical protein